MEKDLTETPMVNMEYVESKIKTHVETIRLQERKLSKNWKQIEPMWMMEEL